MPPLLILSAAIVVAVAGCAQTKEAPQAAGSASGAAASAAGQTKVKSACDLVTATELAGFLKVAEVKKDDINSGLNDLTKVDICTWDVKDGHNGGVEVRLHRAMSGDDEALVAFSAAKSDALDFGQPQPVSGIGVEAVFRPSADGNFNAISFRAGAGAVTIKSSGSKDALISMATLAARRM